MGQDPEVIRQQIEGTRADMTETVDALGYKADVKGRAQDAVHDRVDSLKSKVTGAKESVSGSTPSTGDAKQAARRAGGLAQDNPLGLAIGAAAVGFLAGLLIPSTDVEDQRIGPVADQVKARVAETGQEALQHGKEVAQDAAQAAAQTAKESGSEHADDLRSSAQDSAQDVRQQVSSS